jgi:hypothetical protein
VIRGLPHADVDDRRRRCRSNEGDIARIAELRTPRAHELSKPVLAALTLALATLAQVSAPLAEASAVRGPSVTRRRNNRRRVTWNNGPCRADMVTLSGRQVE